MKHVFRDSHWLGALLRVAARVIFIFRIEWGPNIWAYERRGAKTQNELKTDSSSWGNYNNVTFEITRGEYSTAPGKSGSWNAITTYTKPASNVLLTTGGTDRNSVLNIHNLAGNLQECILEEATNGVGSCAFRGGGYSPATTPDHLVSDLRRPILSLLGWLVLAQPCG